MTDMGDDMPDEDTVDEVDDIEVDEEEEVPFPDDATDQERATVQRIFTHLEETGGQVDTSNRAWRDAVDLLRATPRPEVRGFD